MSKKRIYLGGMALATALLLLLASLQACQPAAPQATGTQVTGTLTFYEEDYEDPPNLAYWPGAGEMAVHGRNVIFFYNSAYSDQRLDGKLVLTSNMDGTFVEGVGIYGDYWGEVMILRNSDDKVIWEGNFTGKVDKEFNQSGTMILHGYRDFEGLTATLNYKTTTEEYPQYTVDGVITQEK